ncbi:hypothetical protein [Candidatus Pelagibacter communis]|uniref:hypothetical protein n=1 Tax=Candidatus Pelagibacter TaxID=198251 RepID=UPI003EDE8BD1
MHNKIIVIGSGNSGSGAIFDYLSGQEQNLSFLNGKEFRLIHDPDGLNDLHINNYKNFSINNSASSFMRFQNIFTKFALKQKSNKKLIKLLNMYLSNVIELRYNALPEFYKNRLNLNDKLNFYINRIIFKKKIHKIKLLNMTLPIKEEKFIKITKIFINNIIKTIHPNIKKYKNVILNQGGNYWNLDQSTKYFDNYKIIIVDRDPRSIYWSMKRTGAFSYPGHDVDIFIKWYKKTQKIFENNFKKNKKILKINYERFLNNYNNQKKVINKFIGFNTKVESNFDYKKSCLNLYKAKYKLGKTELNKIEKNLKNYLKW